jgi:hypothetical protein
MVVAIIIGTMMMMTIEFYHNRKQSFSDAYRSDDGPREGTAIHRDLDSAPGPFNSRGI